MAEATEEKNTKMKEALGIKQDYKDGSSFNQELLAAQKADEQQQKQQMLLQQQMEQQKMEKRIEKAKEKRFVFLTLVCLFIINCCDITELVFL